MYIYRRISYNWRNLRRMGQTPQSLSERVPLNRTGLNLGQLLNAAPGRQTALLDAAVAITEGADPERLIAEIARVDARITNALEAALPCVEPGNRRQAIANYILSVAFGMQLVAGPG
ncbi:MAG: hypothetical protein ACI9WU_000762 [Myxococcota bacterium]|jgi:hypothetical protein